MGQVCRLPEEGKMGAARNKSLLAEKIGSVVSAEY